MKNEQTRAPARGWMKKALCAGVIMGLSMTAGMSFAGQKAKADNGNIMTPFAQIAKIPVVKDEFGIIDYEETYREARRVALAIATYVHTVTDSDDVEDGGSGFPANWIVGGMEGDATLEEAVLKIPSPNPINPDDPDFDPTDPTQIKFANVMDLCNSYYAKRALGVEPITGTKGDLGAKYVVNGYSHASALPCELSTWNDDENIYVDMLDPNAIFSIFFTDVLVSDEMKDPAFASAIAALPVVVKNEIKTVVYKALDDAGIKYNTKDKPLGPEYKTVEEIFDVVRASPNTSPYKHVAYTRVGGGSFVASDTAAVANAIIEAMSIHGTPGAGTHPWDTPVLPNLSAGSKWRSARHEPLGLPGINKDVPGKNWVIEACSPKYAKMAMGAGMHHATALPCEIAVQREDRTGDGATESLVVSYLDPAFMFGAMFSDMTDEEKAALGDVPGFISDDLEYIVQHALDTLGITSNVGVQFKNTMLPTQP